MSDSIKINVRDAATPWLRAKLQQLTSAGWTALHRMMGRSVQNLCRDHVIADSATRHATAGKLGAQPTAFLEQAIGAITAHDALRADDNSAVLSLAHPWFARVGGDVHIVPGDGRQYLSIPIASESYGHAMTRGQDDNGNHLSRFEGGFFFTSKKGNLIYATKDEDGQLHPLYLMLKEVDQSQDRSRLPSDNAIIGTALTAAGDWFGSVEKSLGGAA